MYIATLSRINLFDISSNYLLQDHQGSNRVVVGTMDMSAHSWLTTEQVTHYYPFGGLWGDLSTNQGVQPYKFGGKELDRMYGYDLYDFGARNYDPAIARFTGVDPLAEKYYHLSPYAYCANNPINYIDPDGRDWYEFYNIDTDEKSIQWTDYHSQEEMDDGGIHGRYLGPAVVVFNGSRNEKLGKGNVLGAEGGIYAQVSVYGLDGTIDDSLIGYTMTSDAERYTPIAEGEYLAKRRDVIMSEEDRKKHITKYYQVRNMDKKNIIPTIDSKSNNNAPTQIENGVPYKSDICIHSTLTSSNLVGSKTSTGCLLLEWNSFMRFDAMMMKIGNGVYFPVIVNRTK